MKAFLFVLLALFAIAYADDVLVASNNAGADTVQVVDNNPDQVQVVDNNGYQVPDIRPEFVQPDYIVPRS
ncbi:unnamed protein product [Arctia plantaginis]|uniref:Uncharacterized protein n=1 Tax=Arctia plantaginis TaxID=874455 RepID=A0A8S0Z9E7_ARCPL|nr:unnamed protein product [Arctia plantaginis]CAB3257115.1 unnamed protein product [Arctia plantaginis]